MARLSREVLAELGVSSDREAQLRRLVVSDPQGTAKEAGITEMSLHELANSTDKVHDDAVGLFWEETVPEDSIYNGKHLSWLPVTFTFALGCVHGPAEAAQAQRLLMGMVADLKRRHLTGTALVPMFIQKPVYISEHKTYHSHIQSQSQLVASSTRQFCLWGTHLREFLFYCFKRPAYNK
jgi:hypothetical protein